MTPPVNLTESTRSMLRKLARGGRITARAQLRDLEAQGLITTTKKNSVLCLDQVTPLGVDAMNAIGREE